MPAPVLHPDPWPPSAIHHARGHRPATQPPPRPGQAVRYANTGSGMATWSPAGRSGPPANTEDPRLRSATLVRVLLLPNRRLLLVDRVVGLNLIAEGATYSLIDLAAADTPSTPIRLGHVPALLARDYRDRVASALDHRGLGDVLAPLLYKLVAAGLLSGGEVAAALGLGPAVDAADLQPQPPTVTLPRMGLTVTEVAAALADWPGWPGGPPAADTGNHFSRTVRPNDTAGLSRQVATLIGHLSGRRDVLPVATVSSSTPAPLPPVPPTKAALGYLPKQRRRLLGKLETPPE